MAEDRSYGPLRYGVARIFRTFGTAFVAIGFVCAPVATFATFTMYVLVGPTRGNIGASIAVGVIAAILIGLVLLAAYEWRYQTAAGVNPAQYHDLRERLRINRNLLTYASDPNLTGLRAAAKATALELIGELDEGGKRHPHGLLSTEGSGWLAADNYLEAWDDIYEIEEQLVQILPVQQVVAMANDDRARLQGSRIPNSDLLLSRLQADIDLLSPPAAGPIGKDELSARSDIQAVRRLINRYRSDEWSGLVAERNRTLLAAGFAGVFAYLGLVAVVDWQIDPKSLLVAVSLVITGAVVSLLHQVTLVGTPDSGIEDFGQSTARLLTATFVSGVIALVGVMVVQAGGLVGDFIPKLAPLPTWKEVFDWTQDKPAYFLAALFGFAPSLLFGILQKRANAITANLDTSDGTGATPKPKPAAAAAAKQKPAATQL